MCRSSCSHIQASTYRLAGPFKNSGYPWKPNRAKYPRVALLPYRTTSSQRMLLPMQRQPMSTMAARTTIKRNTTIPMVPTQRSTIIPTVVHRCCTNLRHEMYQLHASRITVPPRTSMERMHSEITRRKLLDERSPSLRFPYHNGNQGFPRHSRLGFHPSPSPRPPLPTSRRPMETLLRINITTSTSTIDTPNRNRNRTRVPDFPTLLAQVHRAIRLG